MTKNIQNLDDNKSSVQTKAGELILDSHKLSHHYDRIEAWENGEKIAPVSVDMALSRACGAMCSFCYAMIQEPQERASIKTKDALNLLGFSLIVLIGYSILLLLILFIFNDQIADFFNIHKLANFIYLLPLSVLLFGSVSIFDYWNNRMNNFKNISKGLLVKSSTMSVAQVATGFSAFNGIGLIPGMLLGQFLQLLFLLKVSVKSIKSARKEISFKNMLFLAKKYKDIPLISVPSSYNQVKEAELEKVGFNVVIYANHMLRASYPSMKDIAEQILKNSRTKEIDKKLLTIKEILNLIPGTS